MLLRSFLNVRRVVTIFQIDINQERLTFIILDERAEAIFFGEKSKLKKFNLIRAILYNFLKKRNIRNTRILTYTRILYVILMNNE